MASTAEDQARLLVSIEATQARFSKQLAKIAKDAGATATGIETGFKKANDRAASSFQKSGATVVKSLGAQKAAAANLSFQLNDIAQGLLSGTSPFTIMVQQGSQVTQALQQSGGGIKTLGLALKSVVSPASLATFAIIGLGGAAVQYFASMISGGKEAEMSLKDQIALIDKVAQKWGDALPEVKAYADEVSRAADALDMKQATKLTVAAFFKGARDDVSKLEDSLTDLGYQLDSTLQKREQFAQIQAAFKAVKKRIDEGGDSTQQIIALQKVLNQTYLQTPVPAIQKFSDVIAGLAANWKKAAENADAARISANKYAEPEIYDPRDPRYKGMPLPKTAPVPHMLGVDDVGANPSMRGFTETLSDAAGAIDAFVNRVDKAEGRGDNPNSSASGVGQFIESTWLDLFRKYYPEQAASLSRDAILGLRNNADISYNLIKKYATENARVLQAAGVHVDEAALQLSHFLGVGDAAKVLKAAPGTPLAGLISAKSIAKNPTILGGGRTVDDAISYAQRRASGSGSTGSRKKTPDDIFQGSMADIQRRIDLLNAEASARATLNPLVNDYGFAVEKARIKQQLMNDAAKAGIDVTPDLAAKIDTLAGNYAKASASADQFKDSQQKIYQQQQDLNELGRGVLGGVIDDLRAGKSAGEIFANVLNKIADKLAQIGLDALFPSSGSGGIFGGLLGGKKGGLFGGAIIPGILHDGGVAGRDGYDHGRAVSPSVFAGAKRYHSGGIAGIRSGEVPAILQRGEVVIPNGAKRTGAAGGSINVTGTFEVKNGNLVPLVSNVSGVVAGQQIRSANRQLPDRLASQRARGI